MELQDRFPDVLALCDLYCSLRQRVREAACQGVDYRRLQHSMEVDAGDRTVTQPEPLGTIWAIDRLWEIEALFRSVLRAFRERDGAIWVSVRLYDLHTVPEIRAAWATQPEAPPLWSDAYMRTNGPSIVDQIDRAVYLAMDRNGMLRRLRAPV